MRRKSVEGEKLRDPAPLSRCRLVQRSCKILLKSRNLPRSWYSYIRAYSIVRLTWRTSPDSKRLEASRKENGSRMLLRVILETRTRVEKNVAFAVFSRYVTIVSSKLIRRENRFTNGPRVSSVSVVNGNRFLDNRLPARLENYANTILPYIVRGTCCNASKVLTTVYDFVSNNEKIKKTNDKLPDWHNAWWMVSVPSGTAYA